MYHYRNDIMFFLHRNVYFDFVSIIDTIIFIATLVVLYDTAKKTLIELTVALIVAFIIRLFI